MNVKQCPIPWPIEERLRQLDPYRWAVLDAYAAAGGLVWAEDEGRKPHVLRLRGEFARAGVPTRRPVMQET